MTPKKPSIVRKIIFWLLVLIIVVWMLFPFYWAINSSFKTEAQLQMTPATFVPRNPVTNEVNPSLDQLQAVFQNDAFLRGFVNSTIVAVSVTLAGAGHRRIRCLRAWASCVFAGARHRSTWCWR